MVHRRRARGHDAVHERAAKHTSCAKSMRRPCRLAAAAPLPVARVVVLLRDLVVVCGCTHGMGAQEGRQAGSWRGPRQVLRCGWEGPRYTCAPQSAAGVGLAGLLCAAQHGARGLAPQSMRATHITGRCRCAGGVLRACMRGVTSHPCGCGVSAGHAALAVCRVARGTHVCVGVHAHTYM